jgi:hypothetical protein
MKHKAGDTLNDPDIYCSDCCEVSGGSVENLDGELTVCAWCGCPIMTLEEYENGSYFKNEYILEEDR